MKKVNSSVNNVAVRRLISRTSLGIRQKNLTRQVKPRLMSESSTKKHSYKRSARLVKDIFVPNRANNYRPHLARRVGLILVATFLMIINVSYFYIQNQRVLGDKTDITTVTLLTKTNTARAKENLASLTINVELTIAAQNRAKDMLARDYWSHTSPTGETPWDFITQAGYSYINAGENLARGFTNVDVVLQAWLNSPTHRANVLNDLYTDVGFAVLEGKMNGQDTILVVAEYGRSNNAGLAGVPNTNGEIIGTTTLVGTTEETGFWTRLTSGTHNLTSSLIFTLIILGIVAAVTVIAHFAHWRLSPRLAKTWRLHHALIKVCFVAVLTVGAILSYGGGMI